MAFDGLRIVGDESDADAENHRARYRWAASMIEPGSRVLDFGCGTGYGTRILCDAGIQAMGFDVDPAMADLARDLYEVSITDVLPSSVDVVVAFEVLEHLKDPPLATFMALEKLAPVVLATVPFMEPRDQNRHHCWHQLQEATFPGRRFAYQYPDGTISAMAGQAAQNLIVMTF